MRSILTAQKVDRSPPPRWIWIMATVASRKRMTMPPYPAVAARVGEYYSPIFHLLKCPSCKPLQVTQHQNEAQRRRSFGSDLKVLPPLRLPRLHPSARDKLLFTRRSILVVRLVSPSCLAPGRRFSRSTGRTAPGQPPEKLHSWTTSGPGGPMLNTLMPQLNPSSRALDAERREYACSTTAHGGHRRAAVHSEKSRGAVTFPQQH